MDPHVERKDREREREGERKLTEEKVPGQLEPMSGLTKQMISPLKPVIQFSVTFFRIVVTVYLLRTTQSIRK